MRRQGLFRGIAAMAVLALATTLAGSARAQNEANLERAMDAVFNGPEVKKLKIAGHKFNVKPAQIDRRRGAVVVRGQLSHHLRFRPDDQFHYTIVKRDGRVDGVSVKINRGGFSSIPKKVLDGAMEAVFSEGLVDAVDTLGIPLNMYEQVNRELFERLGSGSWKNAAQFIVANVALRADQAGRDRIARLRRSSRSDAVTGPSSRTRTRFRGSGNRRDHRRGGSKRGGNVRDHR